MALCLCPAVERTGASCMRGLGGEERPQTGMSFGALGRGATKKPRRGHLKVKSDSACNFKTHILRKPTYLGHSRVETTIVLWAIGAIYLWRLVTFALSAPYKYSYLLTYLLTYLYPRRDGQAE